MSISSDAAVENVRISACAKLKESFPNAKVYVIKYGTEDASFDQCGSSVQTYKANSESEMNSALNKIAKDIKDFAKYKDQAIEEAK